MAAKPKPGRATVVRLVDSIQKALEKADDLERRHAKDQLYIRLGILKYGIEVRGTVIGPQEGYRCIRIVRWEELTERMRPEVEPVMLVVTEVAQRLKVALKAAALKNAR